jgi:hypothetical protein
MIAMHEHEHLMLHQMKRRSKYISWRETKFSPMRRQIMERKILGRKGTWRC